MAVGNASGKLGFVRFASGRTRWAVLAACIVVSTGCGSEQPKEAALSQSRFSEPEATTLPPKELHFVVQADERTVYGFAESPDTAPMLYRYEVGGLWEPVAPVPALAGREHWVGADGQLTWVGIECESSERCDGAPVVLVRPGGEFGSLIRHRIGTMGERPFGGEVEDLNPMLPVPVEGGVILQINSWTSTSSALSSVTKDRWFLSDDGEMTMVDASAPGSVGACLAAEGSSLAVRSSSTPGEWSFGRFDSSSKQFVSGPVVAVEDESAGSDRSQVVNGAVLVPTLEQAFDATESDHPSYSAMPVCSSSTVSILAWPGTLIADDETMAKPESLGMGGLPLWLGASQRLLLADGAIALFDDRIAFYDSSGAIVSSIAISHALREVNGGEDSPLRLVRRILVPSAIGGQVDLQELRDDGTWKTSSFDLPAQLIGES